VSSDRQATRAGVRILVPLLESSVAQNGRCKRDIAGTQTGHKRPAEFGGHRIGSLAAQPAVTRNGAWVFSPSLLGDEWSGGPIPQTDEVVG